MSSDKPKIIAGVDYSMSCPCICIYNDSLGDFSFKTCSFFYISSIKKYQGKIMENISGFEAPTEYKTDIHRYLKIADWAMKRIITHRCSHVFLEGYSMGSKGKVFNIAENTAMLKVGLHLAKVPLETFAPTSVKKFASGKGNADKMKMYEAFQEENNYNLREEISPNSMKIGSPLGDIVDSYYVCKMGLDSLTT